jgi:nucleoside-diphosphate-sugar epimerase
MLAAHRKGDVRAVCGRAADFYGPRGRLTMFGDYFWKPALAGKAVAIPVNPDTAHTYHYIPDVAAGLAALGMADESALGRAWMLPCQPAVTTREMAARFDPYLDKPVRINTVPRWLMTGLGWVMPIMREMGEMGEMGEMAYQWDEPFIVDDSRFRAHFQLRPTEVNTATAATLAWAREAYAQ